jgi:acyl-CoA dehydrogenase
MLALGADLKRKERVSARLGDVLSHLYLASACLKRFNDEGRKKSDLPLLKWAVEDSLFSIQQAIDELLNNFPNRWLARSLRLIIFPLGTWLPRPSDNLAHQIATLLQTPSDVRTRLGKDQYLTRDDCNVFGLLEQTLENIIASEPIFEKICIKLDKKLPFYQLDKVAELGLAANAISEAEATLLIKTEEGRKAIISVDDFDNSELISNKNDTNSLQKKFKRLLEGA